MFAAIVLAAGFSRRMGQPKMLMPWGDTTVIGKIVRTLMEADIQQIYVVTGAAHEAIEAEIIDLPVQLIYNSRFNEDSMLLSLQTGLDFLPGDIQAALVVLGDQPQITVDVIKLLLEAYKQGNPAIVVPSYNMRRGHPWLVKRNLWKALKGLPPEGTLRDFLNANANEILYVATDEEMVVQDLDTPQDYARYHPG